MIWHRWAAVAASAGDLSARILQIDGVNALPITGLLTFLVGVVIAYQGAEQLRKFGTNIFIVDLVGISLLREIAPLIVAILIAGRSGSAYAAEIGTMKVTEELDAVRTLGISPMPAARTSPDAGADDRLAAAHGLCRCAGSIRRDAHRLEPVERQLHGVRLAL